MSGFDQSQAGNSPLPLPILSERAEFKAQLNSESETLESLRQRETSLRASLIEELRLFAFTVSRRLFRLETRQANAADLDLDFDRVKSAENALIACQDEIDHQATVVSDMTRDFNDVSLWRVQ